MLLSPHRIVKSIGCLAELPQHDRPSGSTSPLPTLPLTRSLLDGHRLRRYSDSVLYERGGYDQEHQTGDGALVQFKVKKAADAFKNRLARIEFERAKPCSDMEAYIEYLMPRVATQLRKIITTQHKGIKFHVVLEVEYERLIKAEAVDAPVKKDFLKTTNMVLRHTSMLGSVCGKVASELTNRHINFMREGSGLRLRNVQRAWLYVAKFQPLEPYGGTTAGSSYVPLPPFLEKKHAIVNVQNRNDNRCFAYAMLSALYPVTTRGTAHRPNNYIQHMADRPCFDTLTYPVTLDMLPEVERSIGIPFNVFSYYDDEGRARYPVYLSRIDVDKAIDLLFFSGHFAWIKDFASLMYDITKRKCRKFFCKRCLGHFTSERVLVLHKQCCRGDEGSSQIYTMPPEGTVLRFRNQRFTQRMPFVIYADFEALTTVVNDANDDESQEEENEVVMTAAATTTRRVHVPRTAYQKHVPISFGMKLVSTCAEVQLPYEDYTGDDVTEVFLQRLLDYEEICKAFLFDVRRMVISDEDQLLFDVAAECYVCEKPFTVKNPKVRDHDHVTGAYRGPAHRSCNFLLRRTVKIPIFIHNFRGYDSHLIMHALGLYKHLKIEVIGQGMEKYLVLSWSEHLVFKDSLQFCGASLDRLVSCLMKGGRGGFAQTLQTFEEGGSGGGHYAPDVVDLLLRKGVYPYDYMKDKSRFLLPALPPRSAFDSKLKSSTCSEQDYDHAQRVWAAYGCKTLRDYHDLYLKTDVLLLADVFESFRSVCMSNYGLDPAHYVSAPHLTWDAMMKMTQCEIELLSDPAMFDMVHQGLRGGMCMISQRHAEANNKYMTANHQQQYDPTKPSSYIMYLDANNLYGIAMSQPMPYAGFRWLEVQEFDAIDWLQQTVDQDRGFIVECDLDYPRELHDAHNDYPLAPERVCVGRDMLSETAQAIRAHYDVSHNNTTKLVPTLFGKERYTLHYRNLRFYMEKGLVLRKVHRVMEFRQSRWLAPYIEKNQKLRAASTDEFEKKFFKDMNNCIYGKTCENLTRRTDVRIVTDGVKCEELIRKPHCIGFRIFSKDIAAVDLKKVQCLVNKPTFVGFTVLEVSKLHMYEFYYNVLKKDMYPEVDKARLLFTDTDSLMLHITTDDVYKDMMAHADWFDFSNYPRDSPFFSEHNKMVIGKMKDEAAGKQVSEFVGLRPKMYSYLTCTTDGPRYKEAKRAKGIQYEAIANLTHQDYKRQLFAPVENRVTVRRIGQQLHRVYTHESRKRALCAYDDKRFILPDRISTLAYGHWRIEAEHHVHVPSAAALFSDEEDDDEGGDDQVEKAVVLSAQQAVQMGIGLQNVNASSGEAPLSGRDPREVFASIRETHRRCSLLRQQPSSGADVATATTTAAGEQDGDDDDDAMLMPAAPSVHALFPASNCILLKRFMSYLVDDDV